MNNTKAFIFLFIIFLAIIVLLAQSAYKEAEQLEIHIEKMNVIER